MSDNDVVLSTKIEGLDSVLDGFERIRQALDGLNGSSGSTSPYGALPGTAPASAPLPGSPPRNDEYLPPLSGPPIQNPASGFANNNGATYFQPGTLPGQQYQQTLSGGQGQSALQSGTVTVHAQNVVIYGSGAQNGVASSGAGSVPGNVNGAIPPGMNPIPSGNSAGAAAAAQQQAAGGGSLPPTGSNVPPSPSSAPGGGASWGNFLNAIQHNPTIGGVIGAVRNQMPVGSVAAIGALGEFASYELSAVNALQRPSFEAGLRIRSAQMSGQYLTPMEMTGETAAAAVAGKRNFEQAQADLFNPLSFGMSGTLYRMGRGQELETEESDTRNYFVADQKLTRLAAMTGAKKGNLREAYGHYESRPGEEVTWGDTALDIWKRPLDIGNALHRKFATPRDITEFKFDPEKVQYLNAEMSMAQSSLALNLPNEWVKHPEQLGQKFGKAFSAFGGEAVANSWNLIAGTLSGDPSFAGDYTEGIDPLTQLDAVADAMVARGQDISGLMPQYFNQGERGMARFREKQRVLRQKLGTINQVNIGSSQLGSISSAIQQLSVTGGNYLQINQELERSRGPMNLMLQAKEHALQIAIQGGKPADIEAARAAVDAEKAQIAGIPLQQANNKYGMIGHYLTAQSTESDMAFQRGLIGGAFGQGQLDPLFAGRGNVLQRQENVLREQAGRADVYDYAHREAFKAQADQLRYQRTVGLKREESETLYGQASSVTGLQGAEADRQRTFAPLFGGIAEQRAATESQRDVVLRKMQDLQDRLDRGNLSGEERNNILTAQKNLQTQAISLQTEAIRTAASQGTSIAQGVAGIGSLQQQTAFIKGVGGTDGENLLFGNVANQRKVLDKAKAEYELYKNLPDDSLLKQQKQAQVAQAEQAVAQQELALAHAPLPIGQQRNLSAAEYQVQVLSQLPGSYGNIRSALQRDVAGLETAAKTKQAEYQQVIAQYGGEDRVPENVKFGFQQELQQIGQRQASATQQLSYGWESRLISQTLGTPGSFGVYANRFSFRDAINAGVRNPHMGSTGNDLPVFLRQADEIQSIAGSTGTPEGFAATALTGMRAHNLFGPGASGIHGNDFGASTMTGDSHRTLSGDIIIGADRKLYQAGTNDGKGYLRLAQPMQRGANGGFGPESMPDTMKHFTPGTTTELSGGAVPGGTRSMFNRTDGVPKSDAPSKSANPPYMIVYLKYPNGQDAGSFKVNQNFTNPAQHEHNANLQSRQASGGGW